MVVRRCKVTSAQRPERVQTLIIGGGQAGLAVGYHLQQRGLPFLILDAHQRIGDAWRNRWDSLRLFSPARYDGLAGLPFPAPGDTFPTKDQMADYLERYAAHFKLPVRTGTRVDRLSRDGHRFIVAAGDARFEAENVVVAMSNHQKPRVPAFAAQLDPKIVQIHSFDYRNPSQLKEGGVLVVGVGNSGADIGVEVARTHRTWLAGKESGHVPFRMETFAGRFILSRVVRFIGHHVLTVATPIGRRMRPQLRFMAAPLIRVKPQDILDAGITRVSRVTGVSNGRPLLDDGQVLDVANVIWCTGFTNGFSWIDLPIFGADGEPEYDRGVVPKAPGLYFVGLQFLYAMTSETVTGVTRDAHRTVAAIAARVRSELTGQERRFAAGVTSAVQS
jgi:putative flavoprotein involved in K+ transport